jgi:cytochrome c2
MYNTSGGRIAVLDSSRLLLSIGTFGVDQSDDRQWSEDSDYGKILVLDRDTWRAEVFTAGHRNPEGLLVAGDRIWSTEHGPHGGDELNLIEAGTDYGWPYVSYGTDYGQKTLAWGGTPGDHSGFAEPVFAWLPSVAVSSLIEVSDGLFPRWRGDLLIGSLSGLGNGRALFRVRLLEGRAVTVERIPVDSRVRDLVQLPGGGPVVLWDGAGSIRTLQPADHVFSQCAGCHGVRNAQHGIGPDLYGIVGSPVARHVNYEYSAALVRHSGSWTTARLDRFLADPRGEVPGTSMDHGGISDRAERAEIIQFLSEVSAGRPVN